MNKEAMIRLVGACRLAKKVDDSMLKLGYTETPYADIFGKVIDAIYYMLDENTMTLEASFTFKTIIEGTDFADDECADLLLSACECKENEMKSIQMNGITDKTMESLNEFAEYRGVNVESMIATILNEWVLRQEWLNECRKAKCCQQ